jgi:HAD superfamily hydrolase (TIGR01509 family)
MRMLKAVIFDMDGLMFDTERLSLEAWEYAGDKFGFDITPEDVARIRGVGKLNSKEIFEEMFGEKFDFYATRDARVLYMNEYIDKNGVPVKEGLEELLQYIKSRGLKVALATSTENKNAIYYLTDANVLQYFDKLICGDMVEKGKPDPDIYIKAVESLGYKPEECIVLEDSPNGILAASRANCKVIMVPDLDKPDEETANLVIDVAVTLRDVIKKLETLE